MKLRDRIKARLNWHGRSEEERRRVLKRALPPLRAAAAAAGMLRLDMRVLALLAVTDKFGDHDYVDAYRAHFARFRNRPITLLEIGVGGYSHDDGGRSLVLWSAYFRRAKIAAVDIVDKTHLSRGRIKVFQASQVDKPALDRIADEYGAFDIIIDDGSHINEHLIESFKILFGRLKPGGLYVMEDLQTAYFDDYGGGPFGTPGYERSSMAFLRSITDTVNRAATGGEAIEALPFNREIHSIHYYPELCVIQKKA